MTPANHPTTSLMLSTRLERINDNCHCVPRKLQTLLLQISQINAKKNHKSYHHGLESHFQCAITFENYPFNSKCINTQSNHFYQVACKL